MFWRISDDVRLMLCRPQSFFLIALNDFRAFDLLLKYWSLEDLQCFRDYLVKLSDIVISSIGMKRAKKMKKKWFCTMSAILCVASASHNALHNIGTMSSLAGDLKIPEWNCDIFFEYRQRLELKTMPTRARTLRTNTHIIQHTDAENFPKPCMCEITTKSSECRKWHSFHWRYDELSKNCSHHCNQHMHVRVWLVYEWFQAWSSISSDLPFISVHACFFWCNSLCLL